MLSNTLKRPGPDQKLAWTINELAALLGLSRSAICGEIDRGHLPARKVGRRVVILKADAEAYLANLPRAGADHA
jgi:excisionase family DNA binding protein